MNVLIKFNRQFDLTSSKYADIIEKISAKLNGRVETAYLFGSLAKNTPNSDSDIDLIIVKNTDIKFIKRWTEFEDLYDLYPDIDLLVYTPSEFHFLTSNPNGVFWKDIVASMKKIV